MRALILVVGLLVGCGEAITGQEWCEQYYETYCECGGISADTCEEDILDENGSAAGYCTTDSSDEEMEDQKLAACLLDEIAATCNDVEASANCE